MIHMKYRLEVYCLQIREEKYTRAYQGYHTVYEGPNAQCVHYNSLPQTVDLRLCFGVPKYLSQMSHLVS